MKIYLGLIAAAALTLTACGDNKPAQPAESASPAATAAASEAASAPAASAPTAASGAAPAAASTAAAAPAAAGGECEAVIVSDDAMKFDPKEIQVKSSCKQYKITLKHEGKMPKSAMGHNVVVSKSADKDGILADGQTAGEANNYVKAGDERVIAHTKLLSGGEQDSVTFDVSKLAKGEAYEYYCSFPGHYATMNGKLTLVD
ncbi:azurin [Kingella oralis]|uniref:azurin n=1 Tax=Kingella oralis TaxID=505 RepID=UPI0034E5F93B